MGQCSINPTFISFEETSNYWSVQFLSVFIGHTGSKCTETDIITGSGTKLCGPCIAAIAGYAYFDQSIVLCIERLPLSHVKVLRMLVCRKIAFLHRKNKVGFANSVDPDEGAHNEPPRLNLHCLSSIL